MLKQILAGMEGGSKPQIRADTLQTGAFNTPEKWKDLPWS